MLLVCSRGATDPDGDALTAQLITGPVHGTVTLNSDGSWTYIAELNYEGLDQFTVAASDGSLTSQPVVVVLNVQPIAPPPSDNSTSTNDRDDTRNDAPEELSESKPAAAAPAVSPPTATTSGPSTTAGTVTTAVGPAPTAAPIETLAPIAELLAAGDGERSAWLNAQRVLSRRAYQALRASGTDAVQSALSELGVETPDALRNIEPLLILPPGGMLWEALDTLSSDLNDDLLEALSFEQLVVGTSAVGATGLSVGYVIWLLRGGSLTLTMVTTLPTWMSFDPLPILGLSRRTSVPAEEEESLLEMIETRLAKRSAAAPDSRGV